MIINKISFAQFNILPDSLYTTNFFKTNLYNDINSANLNSVLNYNKDFGRIGVAVENYYLSNVSKLSQNFYSDYNNFRFLLYYSVQNNLNAGIGYQNKFYTDDKNIATNENNSKYLFADIDYNIYSNLSVNTEIGFKAEDQIGEFNEGLSGIMTATATNFSLNDYLTNGNLIVFYEDLMKKQNHNYEINTNVYKRFNAETDNTGLIRYYNQLNDIYSPATPSVVLQYNIKNNIERRVENFLQLGDNLNYALNNDLIFSLSGLFINRNITKEYKYRAAPVNIIFENVYDTRILENNLEIAGGLNFNTGDLFSQFKLIVSERSETHSLINTAGYSPIQILELERTEKSKNNNSRRASALVDGAYLISNTTSFGFTGSTSLLRYDTDFDENFDDRDESETVLSAYHNYNNLINFNVQTRFDVLFSGVNYIYSERSANNFKNRIYKLTSYTSFSPVNRLSTKNLVQVLANYTVYDFEDIISQVQSFSYRQLYVMDSSTYNFYGDMYLDFIGELKLYEQGQFDNDNFSVKPIAYYAEQMYAPDISYKPNYFVNIGIGYKFFQQQRYQYDTGVKNLVNTYKTYGPFGKIILYLNNNSIINFIGGIDNIVYENPPQSNSAVNLQLNIQWNM
ncbi:MAG: hypothetical protein IPL53_16925 [Ignavibacteria bacterium]|nr:hypothetical protein [Ignavibacteria bacterium]